MNKPRRKAASGGWRLHDDRPPTFRGWISTDEGEIRRREWRGRTEIVDVHALDGSPRPFGDYQVTSSNGSGYTVEIRSLGTGLVILLYKLMSRTGAGGSEKGSRRAVPVR